MRRPLKCARVNDTPNLPWRDMPGFDGLYGLEILDDVRRRGHRAGRACATSSSSRPGLVHGGVFASIAESITSMATWAAVRARRAGAQGLSNQTSFLRPILDGTIHAVARRRHRGPHDLGVGGRRSPTTRAGCARWCG